jgi:hypothetical protein
VSSRNPMANSKGKDLRHAGSSRNKNVAFHFSEARTHVVFTLKQIVEQTEPVLFVIHDSDEADWQFLSGKAVSQKDLMLVSLESLVKADRSLNELADLPQGWYATRTSIRSKWERKEIDKWL